MPDKNSPEFIQFIRSILKDLGRLKTKQIDIITAEPHHETWRLAFTTKFEAPEMNYELFELFGDQAMTSAFLYYIRKKYPQLAGSGLLTATVARLKINYLDWETFGNFSLQYGFSDWVTLPDKTMMSETERRIYENKNGDMGIYEDVLEAFYGVTERLIDDYILSGLSTTVLRNMLTYMYENSRDLTIDFRFTTLFDPKTRLKQTVDFIYNRDFGGAPPPDKRRRAIWYEVDLNPEQSLITVSLQVAFPEAPGSNQISRIRHTIAQVSGSRGQKKLEKEASEIGMQVLAASGYSIPVPQEISTRIEQEFGYIDPPQTARYFVAATSPVSTIPGPPQVGATQPRPAVQLNPNARSYEISPPARNTTTQMSWRPRTNGPGTSTQRSTASTTSTIQRPRKRNTEAIRKKMGNR